MYHYGEWYTSPARCSDTACLPLTTNHLHAPPRAPDHRASHAPRQCAPHVAADEALALALAQAQVADLDQRPGQVAQVAQQVVALHVKVDHALAVQVLHAARRLQRNAGAHAAQIQVGQHLQSLRGGARGEAGRGLLAHLHLRTY